MCFLHKLVYKLSWKESWYFGIAGATLNSQLWQFCLFSQLKLDIQVHFTKTNKTDLPKFREPTAGVN